MREPSGQAGGHVAGVVPMIVGQADVARFLDRVAVIEALAAAFRDGVQAPPRHHHDVAVPGGRAATLLLMPAWLPGRYVGTKIAQVFPDNGALGLPAVQSVYLLFDGRTGQHLATIDGAELTTRRTVAASSLAARFLAREDASRLLIVGTGQVARQIAASHAAIRPIRDVVVWGRRDDQAARLARDLEAEGFAAQPTADLARACAAADIISCCTLSDSPLIRGAWLSPGTHLDLIGGFTPTMREVDDDAMSRAVIAVDTPTALTEAGDLVIPLANGTIGPEAIVSDLAGLVGGRHSGRRDPQAITLFKSVGAALEDLAAAALCYERARAEWGGASASPVRSS